MFPCSSRNSDILWMKNTSSKTFKLLAIKLWSIADNGIIMGWTYHLPTIIFPKIVPSYSQKFPERALLGVQFSHDLKWYFEGLYSTPTKTWTQSFPQYSHILPIFSPYTSTCNTVMFHSTEPGASPSVRTSSARPNPQRQNAWGLGFLGGKLAVMARNSSYKSVRSCG